MSSQGSTPSDLEDAFFDDDIFEQELFDLHHEEDEDMPSVVTVASNSSLSVRRLPRDLLANATAGDAPLDLDDAARTAPQHCVASGNALHCGQTRHLMAFEVRTLQAGEGCLSVTMHGPQRDAVLETRIVLVTTGLYRVFYRVQLDGYYVIVVKWADWQVPGSPFLCQVTSSP